MARYSARVTRQTARLSPIHASKDITRQRLLKLLPVRRIKSSKIGSLSSIKRFGKLPHSFGNGQVPDAHFPEIGVEIAAKKIEQVLAKIAHGRPPAIEARQQQDHVQDDKVKAPVHGIGHAIADVKGRTARLCHDRAIEVVDLAITKT